jgi:dTDP-4-amino-4,6-dideoxygalactose transaminase
MQVKFWEASRNYLSHKEEIDNAIQGVLSRGELILGFSPDITKFEEDFAQFVGVKHAIMCGGGTHALKLAYKSLGIGPGDEVICPSHTFIATIDQIVDCGATPILVDIGDDGLIDPEEVQKAITHKTKAIVAVHLEGKLCNMEKLHEIAGDVMLVEDAAQAIGAIKNPNSIAQCFSMFPAKILGSTGNAGMVTTNNDALAEKLKMMRCNGGMGKNPDLNVGFGVQLEPDNLQAAVLNVNFKYLSENLARRAEVAARYYEALKDLPIILSIKQEGRVYQDFVIRVPERKDELVAHLKENGVGILGYNLIPNHFYKVLSHFSLPKTEEYIFQQIRIPCNQNIKDEEVEYIIETIKSFYR